MRSLFLLALVFGVLACNQVDTNQYPTNSNVHTFYYNWYGNPNHDDRYYHWNHEILPHWSDTSWNNAGSFPGGDDIGANFYPQLGNYSSNDSSVIAQHMEMMARAGIGVFVLSWWGKNSYEDRSVKTYLDIADDYNLQVAFHIEPFYINAEEFIEQLIYLVDSYGKHPALYTYQGMPFYYVYDSYKLDIVEWQKLLTDDGALSIRNTKYDGTFIGLWVEKDEQAFFQSTGFDGYYTYFASDGFVYGSTSSNWNTLSTFAKENDLIFIPCVGPGYIDTRIRPWNSQNTKEREKGAYYERMFTKALESNPDFIGITSFNEWHEGTQIEPAISKSINGYTYEDYGAKTDPWFYIDKTRELLDRFKK